MVRSYFSGALKIASLALLLSIPLSVDVNSPNTGSLEQRIRHSQTRLNIGAPGSRANDRNDRSAPEIEGIVYDFVNDSTLTNFEGYVVLSGFPNMPPDTIPVVNGHWGPAAIIDTTVTSVPELPVDDTPGSYTSQGFGCSAGCNTTAPVFESTSTNAPKFTFGDRTGIDGQITLVCTDGENFSRYPDSITVEDGMVDTLYTRPTRIPTPVGEHFVDNQAEYNSLSNNSLLFSIDPDWYVYDAVGYASAMNGTPYTYFLEDGFYPDCIEQFPELMTHLMPYWNNVTPVRVYDRALAEGIFTPSEGSWRTTDQNREYSDDWTYGIVRTAFIDAPNTHNILTQYNIDGLLKETLEVATGNYGYWRGPPTTFKAAEIELIGDAIRENELNLGSDEYHLTNFYVNE